MRDDAGGIDPIFFWMLVGVVVAFIAAIAVKIAAWS